MPPDKPSSSDHHVATCQSPVGHWRFHYSSFSSDIATKVHVHKSETMLARVRTQTSDRPIEEHPSNAPFGACSKNTSDGEPAAEARRSNSAPFGTSFHEFGIHICDSPWIIPQRIMIGKIGAGLAECQRRLKIPQ